MTDIENACNGWALDIEYFKRLTYPCRWNRVNKKGSIFRENIRSSATDPPKTRCSGFPKASEETFKIIKSIDEIAFQTNLLALNAAVEAAQAEELNSVVAELVAMIGGTDAVSSVVIIILSAEYDRQDRFGRHPEKGLQSLERPEWEKLCQLGGPTTSIMAR